MLEGLDVGGIYATVGAVLDDRGFDQFDRRYHKTKIEADRGVTARLAGDYDPRALDAYERKLTEIRAQTARRQDFKAKLGADYDKRAFDAMERSLHAVTTAGDAAASSIGGRGGLNAHVGALSGSIGPLAGGLAALAPLMALTAGAATAMASSFAAAAAGAAAVGTGGIAALTPLGILAGAVSQRLGVLGEANDALSAKQAKSGAAATSQADAQRAAAERIKTAEQSVADAKRAAEDAEENLTEAKFRAARANDDLARSADRAALSEKGAAIALEETLTRLAEVEADPEASRLDLQSARQAVDEARASLEDAKVERARAHEDARRGIDTVADAERQLEDARRGVARANDQAAAAAAAAATATAGQGAAADTARDKLAELTDAERRLLETFRSFSTEARAMVEPATDAIFDGADQALQDLQPLLGRYADDFENLGLEISSAMQSAAEALSDPEWAGAFDDILETATEIVEPLASAAGSAAEVVRNIAVGALPHVEALADEIDDLFAGLADDTADADKVSDTIDDLVEHTKDWLELTRAVGDLLATVFGGGAEQGQSLVNSLTGVVEKWDEFLETPEGQAEMRQFFVDSIEFAKDLGTVIGDVVGVVLWMSEAYGKADRAWDDFEESVTRGCDIIIDGIRGGIGSAIDWTVGAVMDLTDFVIGGFTSMLYPIEKVLEIASKVPGIGGKFKGMLAGVREARDGLDEFRESLRDSTDPEPVVENLRRLRIDSGREMRDFRENVKRNTDEIKLQLGSSSAEGKAALSKNFDEAMGAVRTAMRRGVVSTREGMAEIRRLMRENLKLYGFTEEQARNETRPGSGTRYDGGPQEGTRGLGNARGGRIRRAVGGWLGAPGMVGHDSIEREAPHGASVLNRHQLPFADLALHLDGAGGIDGLLAAPAPDAGGPTVRYIGAPGELELGPHGTRRLDTALRRQGFGDLDSLFASVTTPHYMATGGIVPVPGFPGERANTSILDEIAALVRRFPTLILTDAFGPGHKSPGHTVTGTAADFAGPDAVMDAAVKLLVAKGYKVGYDGRYGSEGWPGHGPAAGQGGSNAHLHVEFGSRGALGAAMRTIRRVRVKGVRGALGEIAQGAVDRARGAANDRLEQLAGTPMPGGRGAPGATTKGGELAVAEAFARAVRAAGSRGKATLALFEAGQHESGMRNLTYGDSTSQGPLQLLASTAQSMGLNPRMPTAPRWRSCAAATGAGAVRCRSRASTPTGPQAPSHTTSRATRPAPPCTTASAAAPKPGCAASGSRVAASSVAYSASTAAAGSVTQPPRESAAPAPPEPATTSPGLTAGRPRGSRRSPRSRRTWRPSSATTS